MQRRFIKTAIAVAISALSYTAVAANVTVGHTATSTDYSDNVVVQGAYDMGIYATSSQSGVAYNINSERINIDLTQGPGWGSGPVGVRAASIYGTVLNLGKSGSTKDISINVVDTSAKEDISVGIWANSENTAPKQGPKLNINTEQLTVTGKSTNGWVYGIYAQGKTTDAVDHPEINITAKDVYVNVDSEVDGRASAIVAMSQGIIKIDGNLEANGDNAIVARGDSVVLINETGSSSVKLNGDINFNYDKATSGTKVDSIVKVNLSGEESYWNGNVVASYGTGETTEENMQVYGFTLGLANGAQWTPNQTRNESTSPVSGLYDIAVNNLVFEDGVINLKHGSDQVVEIENMTGSGGTINVTATTDGQNIESGSVNIKSAAKETTLAVVAQGINADDIKDAEAAMKSLNEKVSAENGVAKTNTINEGDVNGVLTQEVAADGTTSSIQKHENTKLASMKGVNAAALVAWRDEVAYTNQRMEFLRDHEHAYGAWGQVYGGESTYEGKVDLKTTTVQVGADAAVGDWVVGAAFSYMNGDADMHNGNADTDAYTVSLYTSRMFDSGLFVNGLARYGRLSTDATAGNMDGEYDNDAFSIGGNVGYRINFTNQAFVEPTFGLQYAYVKGDTYTAGNGVKVEQDDFDALIASLGARAGFNFPNDSGRLFARASVNHDFMGEIDGTASKGTVADSMYVDLGGTWFTYGVGAQFDVTKNLSFWGNIDRTTGGEVSTNYMMNAGLRYVF